VQVTDLSEKLQPAEGMEVLFGSTMEVGIVKEPEVEPGIEDFGNEAADAEEGLVLVAR
jgi:hypothetical protein